MRTSLCVIAALGSVLAAALAAGSGCGSVPDDCPDRLRCPPISLACTPSEHATPIGDECGIFVSASVGVDEANLGSKERPLKTLATAVAKAKGQRRPVYACAEVFTEALTIDAGIELYGGLDCNKGWEYIGAQAKTTLTADASLVPLTMTKQTDKAKIVDFAIVAADATPMTGGSSIAVIADHANASFLRCDIAAGLGADGGSGATPTESVGPEDPDDPTVKGNPGLAACSNIFQTNGAESKVNPSCMMGLDSPIGGRGGDGLVALGNNGYAIPADARTALGGLGQLDSMSICSNGTPGQSGDNGTDGGGAVALGTITTLGYSGANGTDGTPGKPGQGGGGGGGARGKSGSPNCAGASGGSGGAGGCGGHGGRGGGAAGASIGIISLAAQLTFETVTITVGKGGIGGNGGDGQFGARGGNGGNGGKGMATLPACQGGAGGQGGKGGYGGGGRGGHAIGIAHSGTTPEKKGLIFTKGTSGPGGHGSAKANDGTAGVVADMKEFP
jgi:hypothetical protein